MPLTFGEKKVRIIKIVFNFFINPVITGNGIQSQQQYRKQISTDNEQLHMVSTPLPLLTLDKKILLYIPFESFHLSLQVYLLLQVRIPFSATHLLTLLPKRILIQILLHRTNLLSMRIPILLNRTKATLLILSMTGPKILKSAILS